MKIRLERSDLADTVAYAARAVPSKPATAILAGIRLTAEGDSLTVAAFDYETAVTATCPADVTDGGDVLVSGRLLADICKTLPSGKDVDIALDNSRVTIACGKSRFTLNTLPVEDYPSTPTMPPALASIGHEEFAAAVHRVTVAANRTSSHPILTGMNVRMQGGAVKIAATDRYRLAVADLAWDAVPAATMHAQLSATVPAKAANEVARLLSDTVTVHLDPANTGGSTGLIGFSSPNRTLISRLLDGDYPAYERLLPAPDQIVFTATIAVAELLDAVKRISVVAAHKTPLRCRFDNEQVHLLATDEDAEGAESVDAEYEETPGGAAFTTAFNHEYLLDALAVINAERIAFHFTGTHKPALVYGLDADGEQEVGYRHMVMPVKLEKK